ncbi:MAG: rod shape-determining protein MreC [Candidatus Buchananbacteria bacterium]|nr:rod shape-determining protein MreC [Candidatus Buchananbacteria bacterium]
MIEKRKNRKIKIYILAVIVLLIFLHYLGVLVKPEYYTLRVLTDLQHETYTFLTKLRFSFINYQEAQAFKSENEQLQSELNQLIYENSQLKAYKLENEKLKELLNYFQENDFDYLTAKVIGRDMDKDNTLLINKGSQQGIKEGYPVVVDNGIIIGKTISVRDNLSTVLLVTDNLSQLAISKIDTNKTTGLAQGEFGLSIKVDLIPQDLEIKQDDLIITSGLEKNIPRGLILGKVNRIISHENDLFKSVTISPLVDYEEITFLSVIIPKFFSND